MSITVTQRPSLQGRFSLIWSGDSALQPRPEDPDLAAQYDQTMTTCRERGDWGPVLDPGDKPTVFKFELPSGTAKRALVDLIESRGATQAHTVTALLVRACLREATNLGDVAVRLAKDKESGLLFCQDEVIAILDGADPGIVPELANEIFRRLQGPSGK